MLMCTQNWKKRITLSSLVRIFSSISRFCYRVEQPSERPKQSGVWRSGKRAASQPTFFHFILVLYMASDIVHVRLISSKQNPVGIFLFVLWTPSSANKADYYIYTQTIIFCWLSKSASSNARLYCPGPMQSAQYAVEWDYFSWNHYERTS